jgi:acid phosphatase
MRSISPRVKLALAACLTIQSCQPATVSPTLAQPSAAPLPAGSATSKARATSQPTSTRTPLVPEFEHIGMIVFENRDYGSVVGSRDMPYFNLLAGTFTLLTQHHAVGHPSLPNYLALVGGDTFDLPPDCEAADCGIEGASLPDLIEAGGRTWKTYQDDMPEPCYTGSTWRYLEEHNPFIFFERIRTDEVRCREAVVPLAQLGQDLAEGALPNFFFIAPDICYSGHDCALDLVDGWLKETVETIYPGLEAGGEPYLLILTWDEGRGNESCCGLPEKGGGRVATVLVSPRVKPAFQDDTPYTHYSILKTISEAWGLELLGHAGDPQTRLITAPWK